MRRGGMRRNGLTLWCHLGNQLLEKGGLDRLVYQRELDCRAALPVVRGGAERHVRRSLIQVRVWQHDADVLALLPPSGHGRTNLSYASPLGIHCQLRTSAMHSLIRSDYEAASQALTDCTRGAPAARRPLGDAGAGARRSAHRQPCCHR